MKLAMIGFGQAGGKVVDQFLEYDRNNNSNIVRAAVAVNTAKADLLGLENIPQDQRVLIGQSRVKGHGVGADNELGAEIAEEDIDEVQGAIDNIPVHEVDAFLVVAGQGGGTGSGGAPVLAKHLKRIYTEPVYGLGSLPGSDEGGIYTLNAARSLQTFVREVDNLIVFDNDAWRKTGESVKTGYAERNEELARRLGVLFSAGEVTNGRVAETVVDASEVINTLASGGVSTIGYAASPLERRKGGLLSRIGGRRPDDDTETDTVNQVSSLIRRATLGRLTLPCEVKGTERALVVVSGPPEALSRRGIEHGRKWLEAETGTMEIRGGDAPTESEYVAAVVLLSGVTAVPRIKELQAVAIEAQRDFGERDAGSEARLADLLDTDDRLETLF